MLDIIDHAQEDEDKQIHIFWGQAFYCQSYQYSLNFWNEEIGR